MRGGVDPNTGCPLGGRGGGTLAVPILLDRGFERPLVLLLLLEVAPPNAFLPSNPCRV